MSNPSIIVQKYGGSSVASVSAIKKVAELIKARVLSGQRLCVVVSAMGKTTDQLLQQAKEISPEPSRRELDMLLTCGERASMALLAMALVEIKVPCVSLTGSQSGIITNNVHSDARIVEVKPTRVLAELQDGKVVIVAGFQGVSVDKEITTLGRGGSDTTAVALAAALNAESCEIYSDVAGIFSADPNVVTDAVLLESIDYDHMIEMAKNGAKVMNEQAVRIAKEKGIVIHALKTGELGRGTAIQVANHNHDKLKITLSSREKMVLLSGITKQTFALIYSSIAAHRLEILSVFGHEEWSMVLSGYDVEHLQQILRNHRVLKINAVASVSIMCNQPGQLAMLTRVAAQLVDEIIAVQTIANGISILINAGQSAETVRFLHEQLVVPLQSGK